MIKVILEWRFQTYSPLIARKRAYSPKTLAITKPDFGGTILKEATKAAGRQH
jgi:hypothetical protein